MKKLLIVSAALSLAGCAAALPAVGTLVNVALPARAVGDTVVLEGTRGLILAHNGYQAALRLATAAIRTNQLTPTQVDLIEKADRRVAFVMNGQGMATLSIPERAAMVLNATNDILTVMGPTTSRAAEAEISGHGKTAHTGHGS